MSRAPVTYIPLEPLPRSFGNLHTERCYLLSSLQHENDKATELLGKITKLEKLIDRDEPGSRVGRARKQLAWLKNRLYEATSQERAILGRLGEISQEIQCRERVGQIENEVLQPQILNYQIPTLPRHMQQTQLNPNSRVFVPLGNQIPCVQYRPVQLASQWEMPVTYGTISWGYPMPNNSDCFENASNTNESSQPYTQENTVPVPILQMPRRPSLVHRAACAKIPQLKAVREAVPNDGILCYPKSAMAASVAHAAHAEVLIYAEALGRRGSTPTLDSFLRPPLEHRAVSMDGAKLDILSTSSGLSTTSKLKRHSLPSLPSLGKILALTTKVKVGSDITRGMPEKGKQYMGYYTINDRR